MLLFLRSICVISLLITCMSRATQQTQQMIDYQGTLTTLNNKALPITYITIAGRKKCIQIYTAPNDPETLITCLAYNPKDKKKCISLAHIKEIEIPYPYATWSYRYPKGRGKDTYLLIKILWQDTKRPETYFLIEPKRRLSGYIQKKSANTLTQIPFSGFKKCTVKPMPI